MMSDQWKAMISGRTFNGNDGDLRAQRSLIRQRTSQFNRSPTPGHLKKLTAQFASVGEQCFIEPGIHLDYGTQLTLGHRVYINAHCVFLDAAPIHLGDDVLIGPACQFYTVSHPLDATQRRQGIMKADPIKVGNGVWVGGGSIILPGITIGDEAVIGAGSVVTKDVACGQIVKGNPAK